MFETPEADREARFRLHKQAENWFTYHRPIGNQAERYAAIREKAAELAHMIIDLTPLCADQSAALRALRECTMTANAAIACGETEATAYKPLSKS